MKELDYIQLKRNAISKFKRFYSIFDYRIRQAKEERFSFAVNKTECLLRLKYYGKLYKQYYKTKDLS